jgi:hypothetical protein
MKPELIEGEDFITPLKVINVTENTTWKEVIVVKVLPPLWFWQKNRIKKQVPFCQSINPTINMDICLKI